jgi:NADPH-dependent F420 reductase
VAESGFVLLTVPFESAGETLRGLSGEFREGSVLVDVTVPLLFGKGGPTLAPLPEGSASGQLRSILPGRIPLVGCFKTLPAHLLEHIDTPLECDTFVFGDSTSAKADWMEVVRGIPTLRPIDAGDLTSARFVEGMTALVIRINRAMKSKEGRFRVIGVGA